MEKVEIPLERFERLLQLLERLAQAQERTLAAREDSARRAARRVQAGPLKVTPEDEDRVKRRMERWKKNG